VPVFKRKERHAFQERFSFSRSLTAPFRALFRLLGGSDSELGQHVSLPTRVWRLLIRIVIFPFWFTLQILKFIVLSWTTTRDGNAVLWGIVPMILILAVLGVSFGSGIVEDRLTKSLHRQKSLKTTILPSCFRVVFRISISERPGNLFMP